MDKTKQMIWSLVVGVAGALALAVWIALSPGSAGAVPQPFSTDLVVDPSVSLSPEIIDLDHTPCPITIC